MKIIDNFLPEVINEHLKKDVQLIPYNINLNDKLYLETLIFDGKVGALVPERFSLYSLLLDYMENTMEVSIRKLFKMKSQIFINNQQNVHKPKVELSFPHSIFKYYINDSDGDLTFYKQLYQGTTIDKFDIDFKHTPKQNQAILFNGLQYHSVTNPSSSVYRAVIHVEFE